MLLLDTHILVWLDQGSELLGVRARRAIEAAYLREEVGIAAVSFWEIGRLIAEDRLEFGGVLPEWRVALLNSGFIEVVPDGAIALMAAGLKNFPGDPVDRLIAATTLAEEGRLVTADDRLLGHRSVRTINGMN